jgi:hypothetical protein
LRFFTGGRGENAEKDIRENKKTAARELAAVEEGVV